MILAAKKAFLAQSALPAYNANIKTSYLNLFSIGSKEDDFKAGLSLSESDQAIFDEVKANPAVN